MTSFRKATSAVIFTVLVLLGATGARADDASELERGKTSYDAGRYAEGADRFKELLNPEGSNPLHDPAAIERARAYYAACLIALGRTDEANAQIEKLIRQNPLYGPDPVVFPGKVIDRFIDVKSRLKGEIEDAFRARAEAERTARTKIEREQKSYIESLQRLASQESVIVRHSRWLAAIPFGVGQFQNGQDGLAYAFLVSEVLLAGTSITAGAIHTQLVADYPKYETTINFDDFDARRRTMYDLSLYSSVALAAIALGGILHAELTFAPDVHETRLRPIPKPPSVMPTVGAGLSGVTLGLNGTF